jgi:hypothetical protein
MTKNQEKNTTEIFFLSFFDQKLPPLGLRKGVQATGEAFSSQKRTSSTTKAEIC